MSEPSKLTEALSKVQGGLPTIPKNAENPHFHSKYADLGAITAAVFPLLAANGLAWVTTPQIRGDGVNVLVYELRHVSGETITGTYPLPPMGVTTQSFQAFGSALTYARRYVLSAVIGVATDEDTDGQGAVAEQAQPVQAPRKAARPAKPKAGDAESETAAAQRRKYHVLREQLGWDEQAGHDFINDLSDGRAERWTDLDTPAKRGKVLDKMLDEIDTLNSLGSAFPAEDDKPDWTPETTQD